MPIMGKKPPTPQELYKARKQREEEEKEALLPPGLVNHGNTCFMNSVLQGLIATPMLSDIVRFSLPDSYLPISSRRSPQLTNGHGRGGEWEKEWKPGMPLGDIFTMMMEKAWKYQEEQRMTSLTPREILQRLGAKYDQYLDFRQQDAHELLRHLLDAMRMEEWDIIKKRQPPPPPKQNRKQKPSRSPVPSPQVMPPAASNDHVAQGLRQGSSEGFDPSDSIIPESERLTSFVDMVFGGTLASILVCEKCKKISCTYEDFNDLSLSIKPEDYAMARARAKAWRRERLRGLAKRLKTGVAGVGSGGKGQVGRKSEGEEKNKGNEKDSRGKDKDEKTKRLGMGLVLSIPADSDAEGDNAEGDNVIRASSVPTSPTRHSLELERVVAVGDGPRRRSLDLEREDSVSNERRSFSTIDGRVNEGIGMTYRNRHLRDAAEGGELSETEVEIVSASEADGSGTTPTDPEERERERSQSKLDKNNISPHVEKEHVSWKADERSKADRKHKEKDVDVDGWVKLGRRISMTLTPKPRKGKKDEKRKEKEKTHENVAKGIVKETKGGANEDREEHAANNLPLSAASTEPTLAVPAPVRPTLTPSASTSIIPKFALRRPSPSRATTSGSSTRIAEPSSGTTSADVNTPVRSSSPFARPSSPLQLAEVAKSAMKKHRDREKDRQNAKEKQKQKDGEKQKPSRPRPARKLKEEEAYLRRLLADVPSTSSPFNMFRNNAAASNADSNVPSTSSSTSLGTGIGLGLSHSLSLWTRMGNVQSVEDCLRMFTAVEVLDGENMVRCRRCWKIQNGVEQKGKKALEGDSGSESDSNSDDDSKSSDESDKESGKGGEPKTARFLPAETGFNVSPATTFATIPTLPPSALDLDEGVSVHSAPTTMCTESTVTAVDDSDSFPTPMIASTRLPNSSGQASMSVPSISMTTAGPSAITAMDIETDKIIPYSSSGSPNPSLRLQATTKLTSPSKDSLQLPQTILRRTNKRDADRRAIYVASTESGASSLDGSDAESDDGENSDTDEMSVSAASGQVSARSSTSSVALALPDANPSNMASPSENMQTRLPISKPAPLTPSPTSQTIIPRSKQFIPRRAYKRYLIAQPPPVLVVHLKRFQQVGKVPTPAQLHFFANFKKLDDSVAFPEYLDLVPFLVPKREEFGLKRKKGERLMSERGGPGAREGDGKCMYRLYAVVVHIGNMLGGHYVAYTALPDNADVRKSAESLVPPPIEKDTPPAFPTDQLDKSTTPNNSPRPPFSRTASFESHSDPKHAGKAHGSSRNWCYISDTVVRLTTLEEVMKAKAYICMYERI